MLKTHSFRFATCEVPRYLGSLTLSSKSTRSAASGASMREICVEAKRPTQKRPASNDCQVPAALCANNTRL